MKKLRQEEESREDLPTVTNDAPESKFQNKQQVEKSTGFNSNTGSSKFTLEKKKAPGSQLKQEVASSVVRDSALTGGSAGDGASFAGTRSSGSVGGVAGAANSTPNVANPGRRDYRTGKKLDRNSNKLNYIPNDQVLTEWDESKPLADAADLDQGFNGTYRNEFARSQKKVENVPGALMFDRSVDLIAKDKLYFGQGQIVKQTGVTYDAELTRIPTLNAIGVYTQPTADNYTGGTMGNYLATACHYKFDSNGELIYFYFDEHDLTPTVDQYDANKSSVAMKIAVNRAELWREAMDSKAGDEKADIWTPLARAVAQPTATVGFLEAMEADTGNEVSIAYRKSNVCSAYQLNLAHKDGQDDKFPGVYASCGLGYNFTSKAYAESQLPSIGELLDRNHEVTIAENGYACTMIALYDSPRKYNTKADFIIQPRSYRMHLQTADNNMDPLWCDKLFINAYDAHECFSTIDREYDPNSPVFMTDKGSVIHRLSWNKQGAFVKNQYEVEVDYNSSKSAADFVVASQGIVDAAKFFGLNAYLIYKTEGSGSIAVSNGKFVASSTYEFANGQPTLIFATAAPTPATGEAVLTISKANLPTSGGLLLNAKANGVESYVSSEAEKVRLAPTAKYMYSDLRNAYVIEVEHPLIKGLIDYLEQSVGAKYYEISKGHDINVPVVHSAQFFSLWSLMLCAAVPFIVKARINSFRDLLYYEKNVEYPFKDALVPMTDVKTRAYANFGFVDKDTELEIKRMLPTTALTWILPEMTQQVGCATEADTNTYLKVLMPWYTNQTEIHADPSTGDLAFDDDASAMSMPSIRSGVRFAALDSLYSMTEKDVRLSFDMISSFKALNPALAYSFAYKYSSVGDGQMVLAIPSTGIAPLDWLKLPRQLGWVMDAPYGILTPDYSQNYHYGSSYDLVGTTGYRATYWLADGALEHTCGGGSQSILNANSINIGRAANFKQVWFTILASGTTPTHDHGFALSLNQMLSSAGAAHFGDTYFKPFEAFDDSGAITSYVNGLLSFQKVFWTRIQKLPFIISPFDTRVIGTAGSPNNVLVADPFDMMYYFGLGGFRASDFRESVYNREKEIVNQGYLFVSDPWVMDSPIFKDGATTSGISMNKGFEM